MRGAEIRPMEYANICRLRPLAVALAQVHEVFSVFFGELDPLSVDGHPLAAATDHKSGIFRHAGIVLLHEAFIMVEGGKLAGVQHTDVRPTHRAIHRPHIEVGTAIGSNVGKSATRALPIIDILQILPGEGSKIKKITSGFEEDLSIARPGMALPGGTIRGYIQMVTFGRPDGGIHQPIDKGMGTIEKANLFQI